MYEAHFKTVATAKSLFQGQYLIYRIQVSEKIAMELRCIFSKFYFIVLDYVLYIIDRLNAVFQSNNPIIHSVYADCTQPAITCQS